MLKNNVFNYQNPSKPLLPTGSQTSTNSSTSTSSSTSEPQYNPFAATTPFHNSLLSPQNTSESTSTDGSNFSELNKMIYISSSDNDEDNDNNENNELVEGEGVEQVTLEEVEEFINSEPKKSPKMKNNLLFDDNDIFNSSRESTPLHSNNNTPKPCTRVKMPSKSPIMLINNKFKEKEIEKEDEDNSDEENEEEPSKQQIISQKIQKIKKLNNKFHNKIFKSPIKTTKQQQANTKTSSSISTAEVNNSRNEIDIDLIESIVISENLNVIVSKEILGEGAFGRVYLGFNTDTGIQVAVKEMKLNDLKNMNKTANTLRKEIKLMQQLKHPNIVQYYGTILIQNSKGLQIIMEYMSGKSVAHVLKLYGKLKENVVKKYLRDIIDGLIYLHENHVIHRDIKGANILLNEKGNAKLGDFGCSTQVYIYIDYYLLLLFFYFFSLFFFYSFLLFPYFLIYHILFIFFHFFLGLVFFFILFFSILFFYFPYSLYSSLYLYI